MQENKQQRQAIVLNTGPVLILAGPGSGKTFTIVERIRYLIEVHHAEPSHILVITFTKAAARQMRERFLNRMEGVVLPVNFGTFHAIFLHILKNSYHYHSNSILSEKQKMEYLRIVLNASAFDIQTGEDWEEGLLSEISYIKNAGKIPPDFKSAYLKADEFRRVFLQFQKLLQEMGKLDLDDFAAAVKHLFLTEPQTLAGWQEKFSYILVDEFQDINAMQYEVIKLLAGDRKNLFVVGDDDQAIYGFRGSNPSIMKQFLVDFPEAVRIPLSVNYRSSAGIVETAGKLIAANKERFPKKIVAGKAAEKDAGTAVMGKKAIESVAPAAAFHPMARDGSVWLGGFESRKDQMKTIAKMIKQLQSCDKGQETGQETGCGAFCGERQTIAVIFRTNSDVGILAEALTEEKLPFVMKEKLRSPYAHPVCKDLLSYLIFAKQERGRQHFFRIMNRPCRYIARQMCKESRISFPALLQEYRDKPYMQEAIRKLQVDISRLVGMDLYAAVNYIRKGIGYDSWMKKEMDTKQYEEGQQMAAFFQESVRDFKSLPAFLEHIEDYEKMLLKSSETADKQDGDAVQLLTMHGAKGLEFDLVFMPDCNEGFVPHKKSMNAKEIEEERRMFYVGMTRAKQKLFLSWVSGTKEEPGFSSRFLAECGYREEYRR